MSCLGGNSPHAPGRPQLQLWSVEHAAIALALPARYLWLVLELGKGRANRDIARRLRIDESGVVHLVRDLKQLTRMSRLSLAVMGYLLLAGQMETD
jgi:DNA-binding NarL/FixJ family response regulator